MVGVRTSLVSECLQRGQAGVKVGERQRDVRASQGGDDIDASRNKVAHLVNVEDRNRSK